MAKHTIYCAFKLKTDGNQTSLKPCHTSCKPLAGRYKIREFWHNLSCCSAKYLSLESVIWLPTPAYHLLMLLGLPSHGTYSCFYVSYMKQDERNGNSNPPQLTWKLLISNKVAISLSRNQAGPAMPCIRLLLFVITSNVGIHQIQTASPYNWAIVTVYQVFASGGGWGGWEGEGCTFPPIIATLTVGCGWGTDHWFLPFDCGSVALSNNQQRKMLKTTNYKLELAVCAIIYQKQHSPADPPEPTVRGERCCRHGKTTSCNSTFTRAENIVQLNERPEEFRKLGSCRRIIMPELCDYTSILPRNLLKHTKHEPSKQPLAINNNTEPYCIRSRT